VSPDDVTLPTFIALSYTLGGTERPARIYNVDVAANSSLNDSSLNVTENLLLTLIHKLTSGVYRLSYLSTSAERYRLAS
jgi:hypothetical protein